MVLFVLEKATKIDERNWMSLFKGKVNVEYDELIEYNERNVTFKIGSYPNIIGIK